MYARRCFAPVCTRRPMPAPSRPPRASRPARRRSWPPSSATFSTKPWRPEARPCATTPRWTARWAISSTGSGCTTGRARPAPIRTAPARCPALSNRDAPPSIVRSARRPDARWRVAGRPRGCSLNAACRCAKPSCRAGLPPLPVAQGLRRISGDDPLASYDTILVETRGKVGLITLNRPQALNALNSALIGDLNQALDGFERDPGIGCIVVTGSEKAFAAGADIKEMSGLSYPQSYLDDFITSWDRVAARRKPIIAAVAGFALGGGCELAMMCDFIIAADTARFGQPEIKLGVMPGAGGTQRLTRLVGKAKAMEMCLTGRMMDAAEAERSGLVSRVVPAADLVADALKTAETIAGMSLPIAMMTKESVNRSYETTLAEGIRFERRVFHAMFATADQKEGMSAFVDKRPARFTNE